MPDHGPKPGETPTGLFGVSVSRGSGGNPPSGIRRRRVSVDALEQGILSGDRTMLARAITLIESTRAEHREQAAELLTRVMPRTGGSSRVGITGVPGVGKSTFIEALGCRLIDRGERVAVLAVDPSSSVTGGSILGDKTRMERLAADERAFIRPTPAAGTLGGVAARTRETMLLCEAAGFGVVLVETVGVGQSETVVADMTDFFLALMLPGAGDELQGIKRGLVELADLIAVNKADGDRVAPARSAAAEYRAALRSVRPAPDGWRTPVLTCSATTGDGIDELWGLVEGRLASLRGSGELERRRRAQMLHWMRSLVRESVEHIVLGNGAIARARAQIEGEVASGTLPPTVGAERVVEAIRAALRSRALEEDGPNG